MAGSLAPATPVGSTAPSGPDCGGQGKAGLAPGACDTHLHIYDPRYPYADAAGLRPAPATPAQYLAMRRALGLERAVVVQPSSYGTDNRCTLQAVAELGRDRTRAVVVVTPQIADVQLDTLHSQGARGVRVNALRGAALNRDAVAGLCARIAPLGWHLQLHVPGEQLPGLEPWLRTLPAPVVLDHFARLAPADARSGSPAYAALCRLLDGGRLWLKLSAPYLVSAGRPPFDDLAGLVGDLVRRAPGRLLWGSDWPHPGWVDAGGAALDEAALLRAIREGLGRQEREVLCDNPARLYGFG